VFLFITLLKKNNEISYLDHYLIRLTKMTIILKLILNSYKDNPPRIEQQTINDQGNSINNSIKSEDIELKKKKRKEIDRVDKIFLYGFSTTRINFIRRIVSRISYHLDVKQFIKNIHTLVLNIIHKIEIRIYFHIKMV